MSSSDVIVRGVRYELGELERDHAEASGFERVVERERMALMPELWGWGKYRQTTDPYRLGYEAASKTLAAANTRPADVDLLVVCASSFNGSGAQLYEDASRLLARLEVRNCVVMGLTLMGCASALAGLCLAADLVACGRHQRALVIALDQLHPDSDRFARFGIMSDAAASCLVTAAGPEAAAGYRIAARLHAADAQQSMRDAAFNPEGIFARGVYQRLEREQGVSTTGIDKVFANNVFAPVKLIKERLLGFHERQMFMDNVTRIGHCFSCDSLINLADHQSKVGEPALGRFALQADANGCCAVVVLDGRSKQ